MAHGKSGLATNGDRPTGKRINVAACQLWVEPGKLDANLARAEQLVREAFEKGAKWVILPEFFTSGIFFHPSMLQAALPLDGPALHLMTAAARRYRGYVGGSFIAIRGRERYNTFVLVRPDGTYGFHDKDIPTFWENCYYRGGSDAGLIHTDEARVGAALCWEFLRWQTADRLKDRIDILVGGSCWWGYPQLAGLKQLLAGDAARAVQAMYQSPLVMSRILGVPVVHASTVGDFKGKTPLLGLPYSSNYLGEALIIAAGGQVLARREAAEGQGTILAQIELGPLVGPKPIQKQYWIPKLPWSLLLAWRLFNFHGLKFYQKMKKKGIY